MHQRGWMWRSSFSCRSGARIGGSQSFPFGPGATLRLAEELESARLSGFLKSNRIWISKIKRIRTKNYPTNLEIGRTRTAMYTADRIFFDSIVITLRNTYFRALVYGGCPLQSVPINHDEQPSLFLRHSLGDGCKLSHQHLCSSCTTSTQGTIHHAQNFATHHNIRVNIYVYKKRVR